MPLPALSVLTHLPVTSGGAPRLVEIGVSLKIPAQAPSRGAYRLAHLAPSARVQTWHRDGAHFSMSLMGAIRVWNQQRLVASECIHDRRAQGVLPLDADDIAYLEAYLLYQRRAWSDPDPAQARKT